MTKPLRDIGSQPVAVERDSIVSGIAQISFQTASIDSAGDSPKPRRSRSRVGRCGSSNQVVTSIAPSRARINVTIDIGFGDAVEPGPEEIDLPVLLDLPAPHLRAYTRETVIAEKFHAMVTLGRANSRMKDFYDVWMLSKTQEFDRERLAQAIAATFKRRGTEIPQSLPDAFTPEFFHDPSKLQQWLAFVRDLSAEPPSFETVVSELATFIGPVTGK